MQTKTTKIGTVQWTVHTETGWDALKLQQIMPRIYDPVAGEDAEFQAWWSFLPVFIQSEDVQVPFEWPEFTTDVEVLRPVRDAWLSLPGNIYRKWRDDLQEVDRAPGDPDLLPAENVDPKGVATQASQPNEQPNELLQTNTSQESLPKKTSIKSQKPLKIGEATVRT